MDKRNPLMVNLLINCVTFALVTTAFADPSVVIGTTPEETGATKVLAAVVNNNGTLTDLRSGEPVVLPNLETPREVEGGTVIWRQIRNWKDDLGFRHIHWEQRILYPKSPVFALPDPYSFEGVPIAGGSLKLHYDANDTLYMVSGAYFDEVRLPSVVGLGTASSALSDASFALTSTAGLDAIDPVGLDATTVEDFENAVELSLRSLGDGISFSFVWKAPVRLANDDSVMSMLDGVSGELVHYWDPNPRVWTPDCPPKSNSATTAHADPQNSSISDRTNMVATPNGNSSGYTHEAHWPTSSGAPVKILGYRGTTSDGCNQTFRTELYELLQLPTVNSKPYYGNGLDQQTGGDAVWKTFQTMSVFDELGWDGWDNNGTKVKIVVNGSGSCPVGNARFMTTTQTNAPLNSVLICPKDTIADQEFSSAASLDVVAHEWGHGVVYASAGWQYNTLVNQQLHEGWAYVIGHAVEWRKEGPTSSSPETEDWEYDEDSGRDETPKANLDDGHPDAYGNGKYSYHALDQCPPSYGHYGGMRLAAAYWLAANGETTDGLFENVNPVCRRDPDPTWADCDLEVDPLGDWPATRVFFRVLTVYADSTDDWDDLAEYAKRSAYDLYGSGSGYPPCDNGDAEQDSVQDAFSAIGYGGPTPTARYCTPPLCCDS